MFLFLKEVFGKSRILEYYRFFGFFSTFGRCHWLSLFVKSIISLVAVLKIFSLLCVSVIVF